jgi:CMP-N,N'-diacetyllegionaminic acid synthase
MPSEYCVPKTLGVIPARGGSKRVNRKNLREVGGLPLIAHTINAAKESKLLTDWLVSSEDPEIIGAAKRYGAPVPFIRPAQFSGDEITNAETLIHALHFMEDLRGIQYDFIALLQPTSPIRDVAHIDQAIEKLAHSELDSLASVKGPFKKRNPNLKKIDRDGVLVDYKDLPRDKNWEPFYIYNAALYIVRREYLLKNNRYVSTHQVPFVMDAMHSIDVDEELDLVIANACLAYREKNRNG